MKKKYLIMFLIMQLLIMFSNTFNLNKDLFGIDLILELLIVIYSFLFFLFISNRSKGTKLSFTIIFIILMLFLAFDEPYLETIIKYLYCLSTVTFLTAYGETLKIKKYLFIHLSKIFLILLDLCLIFTKEIDLETIILINILLPVSMAYYDKEKITFVITVALTFLVGYLNNIDTIFYNSLIISTIIFIHSFIKKNNRVLSIIYLSTSFLLAFTKEVFTTTTFKESFNYFYNQLSIPSVITLLPFIILLLVIIYYIIKEKTTKNLGIIMNIYTILLMTLAGIFSINNIFNPLILILYSYILIILMNQVQERNRELKDKVTILALHLGYGGIEQYISSLTKMIDKKITIISTYKIYEDPPFEFNNSKIKYLINYGPNKEEFKKAVKSKKIIDIFKEGFKSLKILYLKKYENIETIEKINTKYIITTRDFHNDLVGLYAKNDIVKISTEHNYHNDDKKYIRRLLNSVKNSNYFVLVSKYIKDYYEDKTNTEVVYIPNVLDTIPDKETKASGHTLISVGRLNKIKAQEDLIELVDILKNKYKDIKLTLVGDGEEKENLTNLIKEKKLEKNITITGFLNKDEINKLYLQNNIFVTTSKSESFGLVAIEAASYKLPVVAFSSALGIKEIFDGKNGIIVENRDINKMALEIENLFEDKKKRKQISENGNKKALTYSIDNVSKMWKKIIK